MRRNNKNVRWGGRTNRTSNKKKGRTEGKTNLETERRMHGMRWSSGLAMDSEANLEHNVGEGVHVGFAAPRNSNLEHIYVVSLGYQATFTIPAYPSLCW